MLRCVKFLLSIFYMAVRQLLVGCTVAELNEIRAAALSCIVANAVRGISYSIAGRQFTFPSLESAAGMLQEANFALGLLNGTRSMNVRANFNPSIGKGTS